MNKNKTLLKRIISILPMVALILSLPMIPGGMYVGGVSPYPSPIAGGFVYATDVSPTADHMIRVHLSSLGSPASFSANVHGAYTIQDSGAAVAGLIAIAANGSSGINLTVGGATHKLDKDILLNSASSKVTDYISIDGRNYPGDLRVINKKGKLKIITHVDMETYILGVVPYEIGNSASYLEAIKAQAVASRTFAYYVMNSRKREAQEHDVVNTTASQVYNGYDAKQANANSAVVATACQILLTPSGGNVFSCYSASNGGHTEYPKSSRATGTNFKYLPFKEDPYDLKFALSHKTYNASVAIPKSFTGKNLKTSKSQPYKMLREAMKVAGTYPANLPDDAKVSVKKIALTNPRYTDNDTPRVYTGADFTLGIPKAGDIAAHDVKISFVPYVDGNKIKRPFLNDKLELSNKSKFSRLYLRDDKGSYLLAAIRYGHSAGMSQVGAYQMSTEGKSYTDILAFYYLLGSETVLYTKDWPIDNGVTDGPAPAATNGTVGTKKSKATYKVTSYSAKGYVSVKNSLNVRSGPATSYKKLGSLKNKSKLTITGKSGSWYRIKYKSGTGYVMKKYIKITTKPKSVYPFKAKVAVKSGKLPVRSGAGTKYKKLGSLNKNSTLTIKGAKGAWYKITYKKKTAYIMKKYVKKA